MNYTSQHNRHTDSPPTARALILTTALLVAPTYAQQCTWEELHETHFGDYVRIRSLLSFGDGVQRLLFAGGSFREFFGAPGNRIASWDGVTWSSLGRGLGGGAYAQEVFNDGRGPALYATGAFTRAGEILDANAIARWDGIKWSALESGLSNEEPPHYRHGEALAVFDDGSGPALYVAGNFTHAGGVPALNIARWDGAQWSAVGNGLGPLSVGVRALAVYDDGTGPALYAGGYIYGGVQRWNGESWEQVGSGIGNVEAFAVFDDGSGPALYGGGQFSAAVGAVGNGIARWDGDQWSPLGEGTNYTVRSLHVFDDGRGPALYVGGGFTEAGGSAAWGIARWDGREWSDVGGGFYTERGSSVDAMTTFDDGTGPALYVAGKFEFAGGIGGIPVQNIARWRCERACYPDCDGSGDLTFFDFLCFQNLFAAMDPAADCDGDTTFTFFDFLCFQNAFAAGCP